MQSSYRIIKNRDLSQEKENHAIIETRIIPKIDKKIIETMGLDEGQEDMGRDQEGYRDMLAKIQEEKAEILAKAKKEADAILTEAEKKGYEAGYKLGLNEGLSQGQEEAKAIKANAIKTLEDADLKVKEYFHDQKDEIIKLAADMAEAVVYHTVDMSNDGILMIINPILERYAEGDTVVITCHPSIIPTLKFKTTELESIYDKTRFVILEDANLKEYGCTIETEEQFIDLDIRGQLDEIIKEINSLE